MADCEAKSSGGIGANELMGLGFAAVVAGDAEAGVTEVAGFNEGDGAGDLPVLPSIEAAELMGTTDCNEGD